MTVETYVIRAALVAGVIAILGARGCPQAKPERIHVPDTPACGHAEDPDARYLVATAAGIRAWAEVRAGDTIALPRGTHHRAALCCEAGDVAQAEAGAALSGQGAACTRGGSEACCTAPGEKGTPPEGWGPPDEMFDRPWRSLKWTPITE